MSILRIIIAAIATLTMLNFPADAAYIQFHPVQTYVIPGTGNIQYARFNDLDLDHSPEVLAIDTNQLVLYSPTLDSVLYYMAFDTADMREVIFDDVNRDGVPDVVEGHVHANDYPTRARITIVDGLSIWLGSPQTQTREFVIVQEAVHPSSMLGLLRAVDINADGKNELSFSYDTAYTTNGYSYYFGGFTRCYYSFPDSVLWARPQMFMGLWLLGGGNWLTSLYRGYVSDYPGLLYFDFTVNLHIYDSLGGEKTLGAAADVASLNFSMEGGSTTTSTFPKCIGNLITDLSGTEILASYSSDYASGPPDFTYTGTTQLRMYSYIAPDSLEIVWQLDDVSIPQNVLAHGGFSGHYLGFVGNTLNLYKGVDGSVAYSTTDIPAGRRQWCYPFDDGLPYLAVMNADTVALYSLAVSTAIDDGVDAVTIPNILAIGAPHPNPFNATQTIPLMAKPGKHLTVDVFNLLGQKVARIYDARVTTAQFAIPWKADRLPSGIYLIRATSGDESATVKSILIK